MQKSEFNSSEITLLYGYSSKNMKHICSKTPLLENTSGELILYNAFNIELTTVEVLHKTFSNFKRDFRYARSRICCR